MLYKISQGSMRSCPIGQSTVIHLVSTAEAVEQAGTGYVFTDGHGIMALTDYFDDLSDLDMIDWPLMEARYWYDTIDDMDRKRRRQAEFLVFEFIPWDLIDEIVVLNNSMLQSVVGSLSAVGIATPARIDQQWYY